MDLATLKFLIRPDADGIEHRIGKFWEDQSVALVFLRHFG